MTKENKEKIELANREWERANADCGQVLVAMAFFDVETPVYGALLRALELAQERRRKAGDVSAELIQAEMAEMDARVTEESKIASERVELATENRRIA